MMVIRTAAALLFFALTTFSRAEDAPKILRMKDLVNLHADWSSLGSFRDNAFIYNDKIEAFQKEANEKFRGATVLLVLKVQSVQIEKVNFLDAGKAPQRRQLGYRPPHRGAGLIFAQEGDGAPLGQTPKSRVGQMDDRLSYLRVGNVVPLELAKVLREGDLVQVEARVKDVLVSGGVMLVVDAPRTSKLSDEESEQFREAEGKAPDAPVVNLPKAYVRYATALIQEYDNNANGVLELDEWNKSSSKKPGSSPDADGDGKITAKELAYYKFRGN